MVTEIVEEGKQQHSTRCYQLTN